MSTRESPPKKPLRTHHPLFHNLLSKMHKILLKVSIKKFVQHQKWTRKMVYQGINCNKRSYTSVSENQ